jgi:hypothetical protein
LTKPGRTVPVVVAAPIKEFVKQQGYTRPFYIPFISHHQPVHPATFFCSRRGSHNFGRTGSAYYPRISASCLNPNWLSMLSSMHFNRILVMFSAVSWLG